MESESLEIFFNKKIEESLERQGLGLSNFVKLYLIALLVRIAHSNVYDPSIKLVDLYVEAAAARGRIERLERFKVIGDTSLVRLGIFPESISNKTVSSSYYKDMGTAAYYTAFKHSDNFLYRELYSSYDSCIEVMHGIRNYSISDDIDRLYDFWQKTNSIFAKKRLIQLGLMVNKQCAE